MKKIYIDTNIFLDFWFDRSDKIKHFGVFAKQLFEDTMSCKYFLVISDYILAEIEYNFEFTDQIKKLIDQFEKVVNTWLSKQI